MASSPRLLAPILTLTLITPGCSHTGPFTTSSETLTEPFSPALPVRLTYNPGDNYWPSWTEDGRGIVYIYSEPGKFADDRCVGVMRPSGGTRLWQMCDDRREHRDSADSFAGVAIGTDGRLIYLEASARRGNGGLASPNPPPQTTNLWLADTTFPFQRRLLLAFPTRISDTYIDWFRDTQWLDRTSFISLGGYNALGLGAGSRIDTSFAPEGVFRATISPSSTSFTIVAGTKGAKMYSLAEHGASIIFLRAGLTIERVPLAGGTPTPAATMPDLPGMQVNGITCQGSTCLVGTSRAAPPNSAGPLIRLWRVSIASGEATELAVGIVDSPRWSPASGDVVGIDVVGSRKILNLYQGLLP